MLALIQWFRQKWHASKMKKLQEQLQAKAKDLGAMKTRSSGVGKGRDRKQLEEKLEKDIEELNGKIKKLEGKIHQPERR